MDKEFKDASIYNCENIVSILRQYIYESVPPEDIWTMVYADPSFGNMLANLTNGAKLVCLCKNPILLEFLEQIDGDSKFYLKWSMVEDIPLCEISL